jgi:hypothetical protein
VSLTAQAAGAKADLTSRNAVNDGRWHHVIAEADRKAYARNCGLRISDCELKRRRSRRGCCF